MALATLEMRVDRLRVDVLKALSVKDAAGARTLLERWESCRKAFAALAVTPENRSRIDMVQSTLGDIERRLPELRKLLDDGDSRDSGQGGEKKGQGF